MGKFKVGDIVKRITPSHWPKEFGYEGREYEVLCTRGEQIGVVSGFGRANQEEFKLVKSVDFPEEDYTFKVGDKVVTYAPAIVWGHYEGIVGEVLNDLGNNDEGQQVVDIAYLDGCVQRAWTKTDNLELVGEPKVNPKLQKAFERYKDTFSKPDGGPAEYYDFPQGAITLNDLIEHKEMDFHRGNIFKACWRWGTKTGTTTEYDARKIIYSGARLLMKVVGVKALRETLQKMLDDPQFQERK